MMSNLPTESVDDFLIREAELLDNADLTGWSELLDERIDYRAPIRVVRDIDEVSSTAFLYLEDHATLSARVARLESDDAWCEHPRTRTRRIVSNVRTRVVSDPSTAAGAVDVRSNFAVFAWRGDDVTPVILTGERHDVLSIVDSGWRILSRNILLDPTVIGLQALSIFL